MFRVVAFVSLFACLALSCRADDDVRQGEAGEYCNGRDTDCRVGLICNGGICRDPGPPPTYNCSDICARLSDCDATDPACESDCRISTSEWVMRAREEFGICIVEELSCEEAGAAFAPQTCYARIEIPADRWATCQEFVDASRNCGAPTGDAERVLEGCAAVARVQPTEVWDATAACASAIETGICGELATCFNRELKLDPAIEF